MHRKYTRKQRGFTLVEILIVVVILGILAAIVVPQFSSAADDARAGNIQTQLSTIQNAIELYRAREGNYPAIATFWDEMTGNIDGNTGLPTTDVYLKEVAVNPVSNTSTIADTAANNVAWVYTVATGEVTAGYFNETTGEVTPGTP